MKAIWQCPGRWFWGKARVLYGSKIWVSTIGIDLTQALVEETRKRDPAGHYYVVEAEDLPFLDQAFDLVISCLPLIDIEGS